MKAAKCKEVVVLEDNLTRTERRPSQDTELKQEISLKENHFLSVEFKAQASGQFEDGPENSC